MTRLNQRAFEILRTEVQNCAKAAGLAGQVHHDLVMRRLERLQQQTGKAATFSELQGVVIDIFPNFSEKSLRSAAKANLPPGIWDNIKFGAGLIVGGLGMLWIVNLPFPMIRQPVAQVAPILLLPSFISMDYHYRQAIALVEQADQLINKATDYPDITIGEQKVKQAQQHLDALPVWFLGYYPQAYCSLFGCNWRFTLDEFEVARKQVARMDAIIFQEKNAQTKLIQTEQALNAAKQQYQQSKTSTEQQQAIADWQSAIDEMEQIPPTVLSQQIVRNKLKAAQRDFKDMVGYDNGNKRTGSLIEAAKTFGLKAAQSAQNPPHSADEWAEIVKQWEEAIERIKQVPVQDPGYNDAQILLAEYQKNLGITRIRLKVEQSSAEALKQAKNRIANWRSLAISQPKNPQLINDLQIIINELEDVKPGTTATDEGKELLEFAKTKMKEVQP